MGVKPVIRLRDELFIEALLASAGLIACHKEDGLAPGVKGEGNAPLTIRGTEAELFHIGVAGIVQRIGARAPQFRPELLQEPGVGKDFGLHAVRQFLKISLELVPGFDVPAHS